MLIGLVLGLLVLGLAAISWVVGGITYYIALKKHSYDKWHDEKVIIDA